MAQSDDLEEFDEEALLKGAQDLLKAHNANLNADDVAMLSGSDNENVDVTDADLQDPDLLAELGDLGYDSDEAGDNSDAKSDATGSGDERVFEEEKAKYIQMIIQKRRTIQTKMKQFQQAMDAANAQKCQQCDSALQKMFSEINQLPPMEFVPEKEEYDAKIKKIMQNFGPLSALAPVDPNTVHITHSSKQSQQTSAADGGKTKMEVKQQVAAIQKQNTKLQLEVDSAIAKEEGSGAKATIELLKERSLMYKMAAKKSLTEKNRPQAGAYLKLHKEIERYIEPVENGVIVWMEDLPPKLESDKYMMQPQKSPKSGASPNNNNNNNNNPNATQFSYILPNAEEPATPQMMRMRMDNYRIAALQAKQSGNIPLAKQYLNEYKTMKEQLGHLEAGRLKVTVGDLPRPLNTGGAVVSRRNVLAGNASSRSKSPRPRDNNEKTQNASSQSQTQTQTQASQAQKQRKAPPKEAPPLALTSEQLTEYQKIIKRLETQMTICDSDSAFLAHDPAQAQELKKWKSESHIWLTKTIECQKQLLPPPSYQLEKIQFSVLKVNADIKENELRVIIKKFKNLSNLQGKLTCWVEFKATRDDKQLFAIKGQTDQHSGQFDISFNYQKGFKIIRDHNLDKKVKYGRFEMDFYSPKTLFGKQHIGHASIKLKALLETSTIEEDVTIKDEKTNKKIGDLELIIKLRNRVEKIDKRASKQNNSQVAVTSQEKEIVERVLMKITKFPVPKGQEKKEEKQAQKRNSQSQSKKSASQSGQAQAKVTGAAAAAAKGKAPAQPQAAAKAKAKASNLPDGVTEEMVENPLDPMWIESFEVMEKEKEILTQSLASAKGAAKEEIEEKIEAIKLNILTIQTQVGAGLLSIDQYTAKIQGAMKRDFALRKYLIEQGRNEEAKRVGIRVLVMKKELNGNPNQA